MTGRERVIGISRSHDELAILEADESVNDGLGNELSVFFAMASELSTLSSRAIPKTRRNNGDCGKTPTIADDLERLSVKRQQSSQSANSQSQAGATVGSVSDYDYVRIASPSVSSLASYQTRRVQLPCYSMGPHKRNPDFIPRHDVLCQIDDALLLDQPTENREPVFRNSVKKTFALCGVGGVGKTSIAVEFCYARRHKFDAIFWIHAAEPGRLASDFAHIAEQLGLRDESSGITDHVIARNLVLQWLGNPVEHRDSTPSTTDASLGAARWLLAFDNARSLNDLKEYWPVDGSGSVLVTSRNPLAKTQSYFQSSRGV